MNVTDIMRSRFATIKPDAPLLEAAHLLLETNQRGLPVVIGDHPGAAMAGSANVNDVEIQGADSTIEVNVDEVEPGCRAPMSQQARFDVLWPQRFLQQRIIEQINLTD